MQNKTSSILSDASLKLVYDDKVFRLDRVEPEYELKGDEARMGNIGPGEKKTVAFYLDPQMCTTSNVEAVLTYRDHTGGLHTLTMRPKALNISCPIFFTQETANTAMLRNLITNKLTHQDRKVYAVPKGMPLLEALELAKSTIRGRDIQFVREFKQNSPFIAEAWYYGVTKVKHIQIVVKLSVDLPTKTVELFAATSDGQILTGLLAELGHQLTSKFKEKGKPAMKITHVSIKDSVFQRSSLLFKAGDDDGAGAENITIVDSVLNRTQIGGRVKKVKGPVKNDENEFEF